MALFVYNCVCACVQKMIQIDYARAEELLANHTPAIADDCARQKQGLVLPIKFASDAHAINFLFFKSVLSFGSESLQMLGPAVKDIAISGLMSLHISGAGGAELSYRLSFSPLSSRRCL